MKTWLRRSLILTQIIGGLIGVVSTVVYILITENIPTLTYVMSVLYISLYAFVLAAGVIFALNEQQKTLIFIAILLQIPIISSPIIGWIFSAGFSFNLAWIGEEIRVNFWLGSQWKFNLFQEAPWGIGVNLFAVLMLVFLRSLGKTRAQESHDIASKVNTILQYRLLNTPLAGRGIYLHSLPLGRMSVAIGAEQYPSVDEVPDDEIRSLIKSSIEEWAAKSQQVGPVDISRNIKTDGGVYG